MSDGTLTTYYAEKIWLRIDEMPIWNWQKIVETGDLIYLYKNHTKKDKVLKAFSNVWEDLQQQYIDEFGMDDTTMNKMRIMRKIIGLNLKFCETQDRSLFNIIKIEQQRLSDLNKGGGMKFYKILDIVSTHKHQRIDPKVTTVIEWGYALKNMTAQHGKDNQG